ncbi:MAG: Rpn family recombination-promoting nuclease/putative transposase [Deferrisomatales bacterium]
MAEIPNPHDAFFRATLSKQEAAREFVIHYLPAEVVVLFDLDSLQVSGQPTPMGNSRARLPSGPRCSS